MSAESYAIGFCKRAEEAGFDPEELAKRSFGLADPKYPTGGWTPRFRSTAFDPPMKKIVPLMDDRGVLGNIDARNGYRDSQNRVGAIGDILSHSDGVVGNWWKAHLAALSAADSAGKNVKESFLDKFLLRKFKERREASARAYHDAMFAQTGMPMRVTSTMLAKGNR